MSPRSPVDVALALRWRMAREVLLDPFGWVGAVLLAVIATRLGGAIDGAGAALAATLCGALVTLAIATLAADALLFRAQENELLRTQPLGPRGLLELRTVELGWWMHVPALLVSCLALGAAGLPAAAATWLGAWSSSKLGVTAALALRSPDGGGLTAVVAAALGSAAVGSAALLGSVGGDLGGAGPWIVAGPFVLAGLAARRLAGPLWDRRFERLASSALAAPTVRRSRAWGLALRLPGPRPIVARLWRDALLLLRGRDVRGAALLAASPLSLLALDLTGTPSQGQLLWQALSAAALGGGAIAYAVGPSVHRLRLAVLPWERTAPAPGTRGTVAALIWGMGLAALHAGLVLAWIGTVRDGWYRAELGSLVGPVLALELSMAHFAVLFGLGRASGREIVGESMLVFALPAVAVGVALAGALAPALLPLYFLGTVGMIGAARSRLEQIEVTW